MQDPELHRDIVSLGMIKNLAVQGGDVSFNVESTTPPYPLRERIEDDCKKALVGIEGVTGIKITFCAQVRGSESGTGETELPSASRSPSWARFPLFLRCGSVAIRGFRS